MKIKKQILINLGEGNFENGFSSVTIKIKEIIKNSQDNVTKLEFKMPPSSAIHNAYYTWQNNYDTLINFSRTRTGFKKQQVTNISIPTIYECNQNAYVLRESLNNWLNSVKRELEKALKLSPEDEVEVVIQIRNICDELTQKMPWHWWDFLNQDHFTDVALSLINSETFNFIVSEAESLLSQPKTLSRLKRVKILCILGDPGEEQNKNKIDVEADRRLLRKIPGAYCVFLRQPTRSEFLEFMQQERWDILFFSGHSKTDAGSNTGLLYLNPEDTLDIQEIRETIKTAINQYQGMKLAIFNSCDGLGLARQLADLDIAQIIVWREPVPDEVAQAFLKSFLKFFTGQNLQVKVYHSSTEGLSLYRSVQKARLEVQEYIDSPERNERLPKVSWLPVIHHNINKQSITWKHLRGLSDKNTIPPPPTLLTLLRYLFQFINIDISRKTESPRESLLNRVEKFWIKGVLEKALHIEETIELGLSEYYNAVVFPSKISDKNSNQQNKNLPEGTRAIDVFGELENTRTMLILGKPGSGKTTALLEIARELINDARNNTTLPIPIVLNLSSWAADKEPKPLNKWLVNELHRIYQFSEKQCNNWVKKQHLLLLLDGLDEVIKSKRRDCIVAINQFIQDYQKTEVVVCCRIQDYNSISEKLRCQTAVFYKQLTDQQIQRYFDDAGEALSGVKELKEEEEAIQELVKSPLTLNFIAVAYKDKSKDELLDIEPFENRQSHQLDTYIKRRFEAEQLSNYGSIFLEKSKLQYSEKQSRYWLSWMAQKITYGERQELLIEQIQSDWLLTAIERGIYSFGFRFFLGIIVGLITVLHLGSLSTDDLGELISLFIPLAIAGIISCLSFPILSNFIPQNISRFIPGIISGLLYFTIAAFMSYPIIVENLEDESLSVALSPLFIDSVAFSIFLSLIETEIGLIDTIAISREKAVRYSKFGLIGCLIYILIRLLFTTRYDFSDPEHIFDIFVELLIFTTLPGLLGLLDKGDNLTQTIIPNQGIWKSAQNAAIFFSIFFPIGMLCSLNYLNYADGVFYEAITIGLAVGLIAAMAGGKGPVFAGVVLIQHFTLRLIFWLQGYIPWNYARFLDYATERVFLRKVGGGYIFIHRILQEHFAQMYSRTHH